MVEQGDIIKINGINHLALMIHLCMLPNFMVDGYLILLYKVTVDVVRRLVSISPETGFTITFLAGARTSPAWELF